MRAQLEKTVVDCSDPRALAEFYARVLSMRVLESSPDWVVIGRQVGKVTKRGEAPLVLSERLKPGEGFVITHLAPPRRRGGRRGAD